MGDFDLIARSLQDHVITHQRASMQHRFYDVRDAAMNAGVLGCGISGSGPAIFAFSDNQITAETAVANMSAIYRQDNIEFASWVSMVNNEGTVKC